MLKCDSTVQTPPTLVSARCPRLSLVVRPAPWPSSLNEASRTATTTFLARSRAAARSSWPLTSPQRIPSPTQALAVATAQPLLRPTAQQLWTPILRRSPTTAAYSTLAATWARLTYEPHERMTAYWRVSRITSAVRYCIQSMFPLCPANTITRGRANHGLCNRPAELAYGSMNNWLF